MEKNVYIAPKMEIVEMEVVTVLAASVLFGDGDADAGQSFTNDRRGAWGNLWNNK